LSRRIALAALASRALTPAVLTTAVLTTGALAVATGALAVAAAPAAEAAGSITVTASSPASNDGDLQLAFTATTAITSFTAHILTQHGTDVLDLPESDFTLTSGTTSAGTWTVSTPISTSQLTLGSYTVAVDAADSGGDSVTGAAAGTLAFVIQPTVTLTASPATLTYLQPTATLSGTVTGTWPDGTTGPLTNQTVQFSSTGASVGNAVTDSSGDFSVQVPEGGGGTIVASVSGPTLADASSPSVTVTANTAPTQITDNVSTTTASYGQTVTVTGTLTYNPGTGFVPLTGMTVDVNVPGSPAFSAPVTGPSGSFSATFTILQPGAVTVNFNEGQTPDSGYPLLASATATSASISLTYPTSITQFSAGVNSFGQLSVRGCLDIAGVPAVDELYLGSAMTIQYATSPAGPWTRLGTVPLGQATTGDGLSCGVTEAVGVFGGTLQVKLASAYYRAYFGGQADQGYGMSTSSPVLAAKTLTEITGLRVSATRVAKGARITFTGKLLQYTSGWKAYGHQTILIVYRKPGSKTFYWIVKATTNSAGDFRATVKDTFTASWSADYEGNGSHYACGAKLIKVTVR
jgi:hypothetical protein